MIDGKRHNYLVAPPAAQMEALAQTVEALRLHLAVPDTWLQVMAHPDPARAAGDLKGRTFFLLTTRGHKYFTTAKRPALDRLALGAPAGHEDGAFPTLYCYLRLHKAMLPGGRLPQWPGSSSRTPTVTAGIPTIRHGHRRHQLHLLDITDVA